MSHEKIGVKCWGKRKADIKRRLVPGRDGGGCAKISTARSEAFWSIGSGIKKTSSSARRESYLIKKEANAPSLSMVLLCSVENDGEKIAPEKRKHSSDQYWGRGGPLGRDLNGSRKKKR